MQKNQYLVCSGSSELDNKFTLIIGSRWSAGYRSDCIPPDAGLEILNTLRYVLPLFVPFDIETIISYNQNAFDTLILSITGSPTFNDYEIKGLFFFLH